MSRQEPYTHAELARLVAPRSIAVVGASERPGAFGTRVLENLAGFRGEIWPVNARYQTLAGRPCYPDLGSLPGVPDCAFLAIGRELVEPIAAQCAALGVGGLIVCASGYTETGKPGRAEQQARLVALAQEGGMRLAGPNTIGILNAGIGAGLTFSAMPALRPLLPHAIGVASQSGALGFALSQAIERGVSISHILTSGNSGDVDIADYVSYLADDPSCRAIACCFEGMSNPLRLVRAAERALAVGKPVVLYKMATGAAGAAAALSHTGSMAGSEAAYRAAFAAAGIVSVLGFEDLIETAAFFAKAPRPQAEGIAVIATSGGAAIMAADNAERHGVALPQPGPDAAAILAARIPEFGSARNPCDVTAQVLTDPGALLACTDALLQDRAFAALVTSQVFAYEPATRRLAISSEAAARAGKIVCNVWSTQWLEGPGARESEADPHIALFRSMDRCFATLAAWQRRALMAAPSPPARLAPASAAGEARALLRRAGRRVLTEGAAKQVIALYGVPVVAERAADDAEAAAASATALGFPVVLKVESPEAAHKTEAGLVRLRLPDAAAVHQAATELLEKAAGLADARLLVQPMVAAGVEVLVGGRVDPLFGPLVVVGIGGVLVELLGDVALGLAPVDPAGARRLLERLRGLPLLQGFRGGPHVDLDRLAEIVARVSELVADLAPELAELDINPLICTGDMMVAVDGLIVASELLTFS